MVRIVSGSLVVVIELVPGLRIAAAFSGGDHVTVHTATPGVPVAAWPVDDWNRPRTAADVANIATARLCDRAAVERILDAIEAAIVADDDRELLPAGFN